MRRLALQTGCLMLSAAAAASCEIPFEHRFEETDAAADAAEAGDGSQDAAREPLPDATDLAPDSSWDAGLDPGADAGTDASNPPADASADASSPAGPDAGTDAATPLAPDGGAPDAAAPPVRYFPEGSPWYQRVDQALLDPGSNAAIAALAAAGGWGNGNVFQIDFNLVVLDADATAPFRNFLPGSGFFRPDCDDPAQVPLPAGGAVEGETGYACNGGGYCHLLVAHWPTNTLFELYAADLRGALLTAGCVAVWDMSRLYPASLRGENCASADGAGMPITPLLFTAKEIRDGRIEHALRFRLPASRIQGGAYVHPATHCATVESGGADAPRRGSRLRLKTTFDLGGLPSNGARVVARALQEYGMILTDIDEVPLTAASDRLSVEKYAGVLGDRDLDLLRVTDFEVVAADAPVPFTAQCVRVP